MDLEKLKELTNIKVPTELKFPLPVMKGAVEAMGKKKSSAQSITRTWKKNLKTAIEIAVSEGNIDVDKEDLITEAFPTPNSKQKISELGFVLLRHINYYCDYTTPVLEEGAVKLDDNGNPRTKKNDPVSINDYAEVLRTVLIEVFGKKEVQEKIEPEILDSEEYLQTDYKNYEGDLFETSITVTSQRENLKQETELEKRWGKTDANFKNALEIINSTEDNIDNYLEIINQEENREKSQTENELQIYNKRIKNLLKRYHDLEMDQAKSEINSIIRGIQAKSSAYQAKIVNEALQQKNEEDPE